MLYSEFKERRNRFITALKIGSPFLALIVVYMSVFAIFDIQSNNFVLLILFILVYIYYIFYMIYKGFNESLIDYTQAFNTHTIIKEIQKVIKKRNKDGFIAMINVLNISYIEEQYGMTVRNQILQHLVERLNLYLSSFGLKKIPIGRYQNGSFLLIFNKIDNKKYLDHLLTGFCKEIKSKGIFTIEIKLKSVSIEKSYDNNVKNIISKLISTFQDVESNLQNILKPDEFDSLIKNAVQTRNFTFNYQALYPFNNTEKYTKIFSVNTKLLIDHYGVLTRSQILYSVKKNGYEIKFDKFILEKLFSEIKLILTKYPDFIFIIKISAVSFRNRGFLIFIRELLKSSDIKANNIYFAFEEKKTYDDFERFREIINDYKNLGFGIVLDRFGVSNSGFEYLKHGLQFDIVSFDLEFVKNIYIENYQSMLKMLILFAKSLNVKTLVKFVEKESILHILKDTCPDFVQGFLFDKPHEFKDF
ncbi:MAG: EAL domain-containing protein [Campylobacteraceae bacterium]|jgi:EAL domain-containing protein (putative c-di-GMP-specific phosphodiesterase class I)/GGDEF domain-containing protein|nr:EAL domain-containing protein [Campylobacteraceae bacterium]